MNISVGLNQKSAPSSLDVHVEPFSQSIYFERVCLHGCVTSLVGLK